MESNKVQLRVGKATDSGKVRPINEDYLGHFEGDFGALFVVCDGLGGQPGGDVASRVAVEAIGSYFSSNYIAGEEAADLERSIEYAQQKLMEEVQERPELEGMGTTAVLLLINSSNFWHANVGDSRLYLARQGSINQLTKDHSEVQAMLDSGELHPAQAFKHPLRNILTRALGLKDYRPVISGPHLLHRDDIFMLCTDGLTEHVRESDLLKQLDEDPQISSQNLVDLAKDRGGTENITLLVVQSLQGAMVNANGVPRKQAPRKRSLWPSIAAVLTILAFLGAAGWYALSLRENGGFNLPKLSIEKSEKQKTEKPKKKKKSRKSAKEADQGKLNVAALEQAMDQKLGATEVAADNPYRKVFDAIRITPGQATKLKFFDPPQNNQVAYIVPGGTVYLAYRQLQDKTTYNLNKEQIEALIALALMKSGQRPTGTALNNSNWQEVLFTPGTGSFDPQIIESAKNLYRKLDPENDGLMISQRFAAKLKDRTKVGDYNIAIEPPVKK